MILNRRLPLCKPEGDFQFWEIADPAEVAEARRLVNARNEFIGNAKREADAIRKAVPAAKKVSASRSRGEASFLTEDAIDEAGLKAAIDATGYSCLSVSSAPYEKKGWFGWRG